MSEYAQSNLPPARSTLLLHACSLVCQRWKFKWTDWPWCPAGSLFALCDWTNMIRYMSIRTSPGWNHKELLAGQSFINIVWRLVGGDLTVQIPRVQRYSFFFFLASVRIWVISGYVLMWHLTVLWLEQVQTRFHHVPLKIQGYFVQYS